MATPAEKQACLKELMLKGVVMVHLDARRPGVRVPDEFKTQLELRLNFNHENGKGDLVVNDWGVRESLRFNGAWFPVSVPWSSVYAISIHGGEVATEPIVYPDDLPEEMVEAALARMQKEGFSLEELEAKRPRPLWPARGEAGEIAAKPVPAPAPLPEPSADAAKPEEPSPSSAPRRGHLRLVK